MKANGMRVSSEMTIVGVYIEKSAREDKVMFYALLSGSGGVMERSPIY